MSETTQNAEFAKQLTLLPNPASNNITLAYVPETTGVSKITILTIDGRKVMEMNNGFAEAGKQYTKKIDVNKLQNGVYLVQISTGSKVSSKKIVIAH